MLIRNSKWTRFYEFSDETILDIAGHIFVYLVDTMEIFSLEKNQTLDYSVFRPFSLHVNNIKETPHLFVGRDPRIQIECDLTACPPAKAFNEYDLSRLGHDSAVIAGVIIFDHENRAMVVFSAQGQYFLYDINMSRLWTSNNVVSGFAKELDGRKLYTVKGLYIMTIQHDDVKRMKLKD
jgi:hypothetical protein